MLSIDFVCAHVLIVVGMPDNDCAHALYYIQQPAGSCEILWGISCIIPKTSQS